MQSIENAQWPMVAIGPEPGFEQATHEVVTHGQSCGRAKGASQCLHRRGDHVAIGTKSPWIAGHGRVAVHAAAFHRDVIGSQVAFFEHRSFDANLVANGKNRFVDGPAVPQQHHDVDAQALCEPKKVGGPGVHAAAVVEGSGKGIGRRIPPIATVEIDLEDLRPGAAQVQGQTGKEGADRPLQQQHSFAAKCLKSLFHHR